MYLPGSGGLPPHWPSISARSLRTFLNPSISNLASFESLCWVGHHLIGPRCHGRRQLGFVHEQLDGLRLVGSIEQPTAALDDGCDIAHERIAVRLRPVAHHDDGTRLVCAN